jgi:small subunit ribosomal protein S7e
MATSAAAAAAASVSKKLVKKDAEPTSDLEVKIAAELEALEKSGGHWKADLKGLHFTKATPVELDGGRKVAVIFVPPPMLKDFRKCQQNLVNELEKKLVSMQVLLVANRTMVPPGLWQRSKMLSGVRPRSRTLKNVQDNLLDDLLFPTEIAGKRTKVKMDGSRLLKVLLSKKDQDANESKTEGLRVVFKKLTNRDITFEYV